MPPPTSRLSSLRPSMSISPRPASRLFRPVCRSCLTRGARAPYHSYDRPTEPAYGAAESAILSAALSHVPRHGFTPAALQAGAKDAGYLSISTNLFPRGVFDLVVFHLASRRLQLKERVDGGERNGGLQRYWSESRMGVGGKVRGLVLERLCMNIESGTVPCWQEVRFGEPLLIPN